MGDCFERRLAADGEPPKAIYAEVDPVDNRAEVPPSPGQGGGNPGDIGGMSDIPLVTPSDGKSPQGATRDPVAETLLAEIVPIPSPSQAIPFSGPYLALRRPARGSFRARAPAAAVARVGVLAVAPVAGLDQALSFSAHAITPIPSPT